MIHLERFPKPAILVKKEKEWTENYINSGKSRPDSNKYGHREIRELLNEMSFGKCFYCEKKISHERQEIDHFIEVSDKMGKDLAFNWDNLFLACNNCNRKMNNQSIPVTDVLNPCTHSDDEIYSNLDFVKEQITAKENSTLGFKTIQKFRLNSPELDYYRLRRLASLKDVVIQIQKNQIKEHRSEKTKKEKEVLLWFAQKDQPFSFMFKCLFEKKGFL